MNRSDLQLLAKTRLREARVLLDAKCFSGAYYLAGYAIECGLKACIAKQIRRSTFPDKNLATQAFTHNLEQLVKTAGLDAALKAALKNPLFLDNWNVVKDWSVETRYDLTTSAKEAIDMHSACSARTHGVLSWVKTQW